MRMSDDKTAVVLCYTSIAMILIILLTLTRLLTGSDTNDTIISGHFHSILPSIPCH